MRAVIFEKPANVIARLVLGDLDRIDLPLVRSGHEGGKGGAWSVRFRRNSPPFRDILVVLHHHVHALGSGQEKES